MGQQQFQALVSGLVQGDELLWAAPVGVAVINPQGLYVAVNPAYCDIYGYQEGELLGASVVTVFPESWREMVIQRHLAFIQQGGSLEGEWSTVHRTGRALHVVSKSVRVQDPGGTWQRLVYVTDITDHRQLEDELRRSLSRNRALIEAMPDLILTFAGNGTYQSVESSARELLLDEPANLIGKQVTQVLPEPLGRRFEEAITTAMVTGSLQLLTYPLKTSGVARYFEARLMPMSGDQVIAVVRDVSEKVASETQLQNLAFYDPLTSLPNRRLMFDRLQQVLALSHRSHALCAVLLIDLDHFKALNDAMGHEVGDLLLVDVAARLQDCVRETDTVARLGGDEFVVILSQLESLAVKASHSAIELAEKIRKRLSEPYELSPEIAGTDSILTIQHRCTASIGLTLGGMAVESAKDVLRRADMLMYQAKDSGGNRVCHQAIADGHALEVDA